MFAHRYEIQGYVLHKARAVKSWNHETLILRRGHHCHATHKGRSSMGGVNCVLTANLWRAFVKKLPSRSISHGLI